MRELLRALLQDDPVATPTPDVTTWWSHHRTHAVDGPPIEGAIRAGFRADRVGFAFAGGYHAALRALVPSLPHDRIVGLCATEAGGVHPRAIETRLDLATGHLGGTKTFATLATVADELLIVASTGTAADGKNRLAVVRIARAQDGVVLQALPETPFTPEIPHAVVRLDLVVRADDVLPGDGWNDYLKPFRTIEDLHVHGALLGHLVALARRGGMKRAVVEELAMLVTTVWSLAISDPRDVAVHVAVGGVIAATVRTLEAFVLELPDANLDDETKKRFERDRRLLGVAGKARASRLESAWKALGRA